MKMKIDTNLFFETNLHCSRSQLHIKILHVAVLAPLNTNPRLKG